MKLISINAYISDSWMYWTDLYSVYIPFPDEGEYTDEFEADKEVLADEGEVEEISFEGLTWLELEVGFWLTWVALDVVLDVWVDEGLFSDVFIVELTGGEIGFEGSVDADDLFWLSTLIGLLELFDDSAGLSDGKAKLASSFL